MNDVQGWKWGQIYALLISHETCCRSLRLTGEHVGRCGAFIDHTTWLTGIVFTGRYQGSRFVGHLHFQSWSDTIEWTSLHQESHFTTEFGCSFERCLDRKSTLSLCKTFRASSTLLLFPVSSIPHTFWPRPNYLQLINLPANYRIPQFRQCHF